MLFDDEFVVEVTLFRKFYFRSKTVLLPENRSTPPQTNVGKQQIVANKYLLSLHEIGGIKGKVNSPTVEPSTRHILAPPGHA